MKYRVLTQSLHFPQWEEKLRFRILFPSRYPFREFVWDDYAASDNYGLKVGDEEKALGHAFMMFERIQKARTGIEASCRDRLIGDFQNLLRCYDCGMTVRRPETEELISSMLAMDGCARPVASAIQSYHESYVKAAAEDHDFDFHRSRYALDFVDLYAKAGDKALFIDQDPDLAMQFYRLAALIWRDPKASDSHSLAVDWLIRQLNLSSVLRHSIFIYAAQDIKDAFINVSAAVKDSVNNERCVELANKCLDVYEQSLQAAGDDVDSIRELVMIAWAVKKAVLIPALCCLYGEPQEVVTRLAQDTKATISSLRFPDAPTKPMLSYLDAHAEDDTSIWDLLRFACAIDITQRIQGALRIQRVNRDLAYYTSLNTLMYMLPARCKDERDWGKLSVMNLAYMNDPNEGKMLHKYLLADRDLDGLGERKSAAYPFVFMKCFTSRVDDLPMWEMYGDHAQGVCIVVDRARTARDASKAAPLYRVCYLSKRGDDYELNPAFNPGLEHPEEIRAWLDELQDLRAGFIASEPKRFFDSLLEGIAYLFKDSSYHYEQEARILYAFSEVSDQFRRTGGEYPLLYVQSEFPLAIREIIIGPKFEDLARRMPYLREQIELMCKTLNTPCPKLTLSSIEYR